MGKVLGTKVNIHFFALLDQIFSLLPKNTSKRILILLAFQICVTGLDIFAIVLLGLTTKAGLDYVQSRELVLPQEFLKFFNAANLSTEIQFTLLATSIIVLFVVRTFISIYGNKRVLRYLANQASIASKEVLAKLINSKPEYLITRDTQGLLYAVTSGIDSLTLGYLASFVLVATEAFFLLSMSTTIIILQPVTGLCALGIFAFAFAVIYKSTASQSRAKSLEISELTILNNRKFLDTLLIYRELVLRGKKNSTLDSVQSSRSRALQLRADLLFLPTLTKYMFEFALLFGGAVIASLQLLISDANTAITSLIIFVVGSSRILPSIVRAQAAILNMKKSEGFSKITLVEIKEIEKNLDSETSQAEDSEIYLEFQPQIEFKNVDFVYGKEGGFALHDVSFVVEPGKMVAIVGDSGAGKSTIADLMLGMLSPTNGQVLVSGVLPISAINRWPGEIAYVPQDIAIIDGDIAFNVSLEANSQHRTEEIKEALSKGHLLSDVLKMPNGLSEAVGERGARLSGGQRQRLGIARALFTNPKLIILDEATSALDSLTEKAVTEAIFSRSSGETLVVIAHRLSTVKNADTVLYIEKGKVLAQGTFEQVRKFVPKFDEQAKLVNL